GCDRPGTPEDCPGTGTEQYESAYCPVVIVEKDDKNDGREHYPCATANRHAALPSTNACRHGLSNVIRQGQANVLRMSGKVVIFGMTIASAGERGGRQHKTYQSDCYPDGDTHELSFVSIHLMY